MREVEHVNRVNLDHTLGRHIGIFGAGGKSTLARAIARKLDLAYIEIDAIQHLPGWQMRPKDEVETIINQCMVSSTGGWVTDHNYRSILERAESIIVLELPFRTVFWRRLKRSLHRAWTQELVCGGNTETFKQHLLTRESAILEAWVRRKSYGRIYEALSPDMPTELTFSTFVQHVNSTNFMKRTAYLDLPMNLRPTKPQGVSTTCAEV